jgi:hypothetical protein
VVDNLEASLTGWSFRCIASYKNMKVKLNSYLVHDSFVDKFFQLIHGEDVIGITIDIPCSIDYRILNDI